MVMLDGKYVPVTKKQENKKLISFGIKNFFILRFMIDVELCK